jgi:hypothetical protein
MLAAQLNQLWYHAHAMRHAFYTEIDHIIAGISNIATQHNITLHKH